MEVPDQPLPAATFEELAMPLFDQLYNFARWLTQDTAEAEDLVQETYTKALRGFSSFQAGHEFPGMDVPHPAEFVLEFAHGTQDHGGNRWRSG